jgi:hypothetical protein
MKKAADLHVRHVQRGTDATSERGLARPRRTGDQDSPRRTWWRIDGVEHWHSGHND